MTDMSDYRQGQLEELARKKKGVAGVLGFLLGPLGYVYVGKWGLALICLLTFNYALLGIVIVPIHTRRMIESARQELEAAE